MKYLFLLMLSFNCLADDWRTEDTKREVVYIALHAIDWAQTLKIRKHDNMEESGIVAQSMIGAHPTNVQVNTYMAGSAILQYAIARELPIEYRSLFQHIMIVDSGISVLGNFRIGFSIGF